MGTFRPALKLSMPARAEKGRDDMKHIFGIERFDAHGKPADRMEFSINRSGDSIYLFIGPGNKTQRTANYKFSLQEWLDLNGGIITPAELATVDGTPLTGVSELETLRSLLIAVADELEATERVIPLNLETYARLTKEARRIRG